MTSMHLAISVNPIFFLLIGNDEEQDMELSKEVETKENSSDSTVNSVPEVSMHALAG